VLLVGASKRQPPERVAAAVRAGVGHLGENFAQEARDKRDAVHALLGEEAASPRWHMIGRLQRNKAALALRVFDCIESVDRPELARALDRRASAAGIRLEVLLQVDVSGEAQKAGAPPDALPALLAACAALPALDVRGLMAIPAAPASAEDARPAFARLRALRDTLSREPGGEALRELSMGMSGDFQVAVEEGATRVRIGTALFGERHDE